MFCSKCGTELKDGDLFCSRCGNRLNPSFDAEITPKPAENEAVIEKPAEAPVKSEVSSDDVTEIFPTTAELTDEQRAKNAAAFAQTARPEGYPVPMMGNTLGNTTPVNNGFSATNGFSAAKSTVPPPPPVIPAQTAPINEKQYFGKPALIFCVAAIAVLSIVCGIFAGLYFSTSPLHEVDEGTVAAYEEYQW